MAITGTYEYNGIPVVGAVAEVNFIQFREPANPTAATFTVGVFANAAQYAAGSNFTQNSYSFVYDETGGDVWGQCYDYLDSLPEYAGWQPFVPPSV